MANPEITIIAVSNVFCRLMTFKNKGDIEEGHKHTYHHATLVSSGSVRVEILDDGNKNILFSKEFTAPNFIFTDKDKNHRLISLEDNTVCSCIHAVRDIEGEIVDPAFLIEPVWSENKGEMINLVAKNHGKPMMPFVRI